MAKRSWGEAYNWAQSKLKDININDPNQIQNLLQQNGWKNGMMDEVIGWGKKAAVGAKMAKKIGIDPLKKMGIDIDKIDIDSAEKTARSLLGTNKPNPQYASYDIRNSPTYTGISFSSRASSLPD